MLTIALDATYAADLSPTGIGVYSQRLIASLAALINSEAQRLMLCFRPGPYLRARKMQWPTGCSLSPLLEWWPAARQAKLFHGLNQRLTCTRYSARIVTIHDLFPLTSAEYSKPQFQRLFTEILRGAIARADRIIAVSHATRQELLRHTEASDSKIRVVHHGVDPAQIPTEAERNEFRRVLGLKSGERFVLNVGTIQVRKNIGNIALAMKQVPDLRLVLAGGEGYGAERILALVESEGLKDRIIRLGHTPKEQLRLLYSTAEALVFPSVEEGFGFPVLEAMSYGLPVITSNCSSMPEIAGDAALLVDPRDVSQIAEAMRRVTEDVALAERLRSRGKKRATLFSWEKCANETWAVYQELLGT
ncbi:MAG: glycosyltransferase family 4 protein [Acidobacteria bacterium]|nr:glycosyltransferase family 4 protein [Acidobacteriota bacterium]